MPPAGAASAPPSSTSTSPAPLPVELPNGGTAHKVPPDESLTPEEYLGLGMPAHDRSWIGQDLPTAAKVLTDLGEAGYRQLPRYQSKRSGEVFARLTSAQDLEYYRSPQLPLTIRLPQLLEHFKATGQFLSLYLSAFLKGAVADSELIEMFGSTLRASVVMVELVDEFVPTLDKDDPTYPVRMNGLKTMKSGLANIVSGSLQTLTERHAYRDSELLRLLGYMQETCPVLIPQLTPASQTEMLLRIEKMRADPAMRAFQPGLQELHVRVKAEVERKSSP